MYVGEIHEDTLDRLVRRVGSVVGAELDSLVTVVKTVVFSILDNAQPPLLSTFTRQECVGSMEDCCPCP